jgi:hypothetical protein
LVYLLEKNPQIVPMYSKILKILRVYRQSACSHRGKSVDDIVTLKSIPAKFHFFDVFPIICTKVRYNTYLYEGRPPAPICSPGLAAIRAVIYPEQTEYLYFLHDGEGKIHVALTYEEHLKNIEKYLTGGQE